MNGAVPLPSFDTKQKISLFLTDSRSHRAMTFEPEQAMGVILWIIITEKMRSIFSVITIKQPVILPPLIDAFPVVIKCIKRQLFLYLASFEPTLRQLSVRARENRNSPKRNLRLNVTYSLFYLQSWGRDCGRAEKENVVGKKGFLHYKLK